MLLTVTSSGMLLPPLPWHNSPNWLWPLNIEDSWPHSHTTLARSHLDEWSTRRSELYLTTHTTLTTDSHTCRPMGFESASPAIELPQTNTLDVAATGIG